MANGKDSAVFKVGADIREPQKAIAEINALVKKMADNTNAASVIGVKAFRAESEAARELLRQFGASDKQLGELARTTQRVDAAATAHLTRIGGAARGLASGFEVMARSGNFAGEATRQIIAQGAEMAFTFGAGGPIVGAVGIAGAAIIELFQRSRREMEETRKKAIDVLAKLVDAGDIHGIMVRMRDLELGKASAGLGQGGGFVGGLRDLKAQLATQRGILTDFEQRGSNSHPETTLHATQQAVIDLQNRIRPLQEDFDRLRRTVLNFPTLPQDIAGLNAVTTTAHALAVIAKDDAQSWAERVKAARDLEALQLRIADAAKKAREEQDAAYNRATGVGGPAAPLFTRVSGEQAAAEGAAGLAAGHLGPNQSVFWSEITNGASSAADSMAQYLDAASASARVTAQLGDVAVSTFAALASGASAGKALKSGVLNIVKDEANQLGKFYLARSISDVGDAIVFRDPSYLIAAGEHAAASTAFFAVGAASGYNASGHSGGGGTGGARMNTAMGDSFSDTNKGTATITIVGGILDTGDTRQMDALADAIKSITDRNIIIQRA